MNVTVEHLEGHIAEVTIVVDDERMEKARRAAARRLAKELRIPGFRPGKAPYQVILSAMGVEALTREALTDLGDDLFKEALEEAEIEVYDVGTVVDVKIEDNVSLVIQVPKRPHIDLRDYRSLRLDYEPPELTDEMVDKSVKRTWEELGLTEKVDRPAEIGDSVVMNIRGVLEIEEESEESEEEDAPEKPEKLFIDETHFVHILTDDADRDLLPGFSAELVGLSVGESKSFSLDVPEDYDIEDFAGLSINFEASLFEVDHLILPADDDFVAELASDGEIKTHEELNERVREGLRDALESRADEQYYGKVMDKLVTLAELIYPEQMVEDYIDDIMDEMDSFLHERAGLGLSDYLSSSGQALDALRQQQRGRAIERLERSLVLGAVAEAEGLLVEDDEVTDEFKKRFESLEDEEASFMNSLMASPEFRDRIASNIATERTIKRVIDIAKGEDPPTGPDPSEAEDEEPETAVEQQE